MKIVFNSYQGIGAWFILRLLDEGHSVDYHVMNEDCLKVLEGLVPDPKREIDYSKYDLSLFDLTGKPRQADKSLEITPTIGDSSFASQLEDDRVFGIEAMEQADILVPEWEQFDDVDKAIKFIRKYPDRYVFKPSGSENQGTFTTYVGKSPEDLIDYLAKLGEFTHGAEFILQKVVIGTEVSTEAWFNGEDFSFVNHTLECKKLMNGDIGPSGGCAGNLVWATEVGRENKLYKEGLSKIREFLYDNNFRGMLDLNSIVTDSKLYGLEWTPRFGYDASATVFSFIREGEFGNFLYAVAAGLDIDSSIFDTRSFGAAVRLSIPPYPREIRGKHPQGIPIKGIDEDNIHNYYLFDAMIDDSGEMVTSGEGWGIIGCPIAKGEEINIAFAKVKEMIKNVKVPDLMYRTDIYQNTFKRYNELARNGWLKI